MNDVDALAALKRNRSEAALEALYERHRQMVYSVCFRITEDSEMAKDAAQSVFVKLYRKAPAIPTKTCVAGWLFRAARLEALSFRRAESIRKRNEQQSLDMNNLETESLETLWARVKPILDDAIADLPVTLRDAIVLCYIEGVERGEAAKLLGCGEATMRKRLSRGVEKLRLRLRGKGVVISSSILATILVEQSIEAAIPTGWATTKSLIAMAGKIGIATAVAQGVLKIMNSTSKKAIIAVAISIAAIGMTATLKKAYQTTKGEKTLLAASNAQASGVAGKGRLSNKNSSTASGLDVCQTTNQSGTASQTKSKANAAQIPDLIKVMSRVAVAKNDEERFNHLSKLLLPIDKNEFKVVMKKLRELKKDPNYPDSTIWKANFTGEIFFACLDYIVGRHSEKLLSWTLKLEKQPRSFDLFELLLAKCVELHPERTKRLLETDPVFSQKSEIIGMMRQPGELLSNLVQNSENKMVYEVKFKKLLAYGSLLNPEETIHWLENNLDNVEKNKAIMTILPALVYSDINEAKRLFNTLPDDLKTKKAAVFITSPWFEEEPEKVVEFIVKQGGTINAKGFGAFRIDYLSDEKFYKLADYLENTLNSKTLYDMGFMNKILMRLARTRPEQASRIAEKTTFPAEVKASIVSQYAICNPEKMEEIVNDTLSDPAYKRRSAREKAYFEHVVLSNWSLNNPREAYEWVKKSGATATRLAAVMSGWAKHDPEAALEIVEKEKIKLSYEGNKALFMGIMETDVDSALSFFDSIKSQKDKENILKCLNVVQLNLIPKNKLAAMLKKTFAGVDYDVKMLNAAARYGPILSKADTIDLLNEIDLTKVETEQGKDALRGLMSIKKEGRRVNYSKTLDWLMSKRGLSPRVKEMTSTALRTGYKNWCETDNEAAREWLDNQTQLDEYDKQELTRFAEGKIKQEAALPFAPRVVETIPANGATNVDYNLKEIKVFFDRELSQTGFSVCRKNQNEFPKVTGQCHYNASRDQFTVPVKLLPGKRYSLYFNKGKYRGFVSQKNGVPLKSYLLSFTTKNAPAKKTAGK